MIRLIKRYHPGVDYRTVNKKMMPWRILGLFCLLVAIFESVFHLILQNAAFWYVLSISLVWNDVMRFFQIASNGYILSDRCIYFWRSFKKHKVEFREVHSIYIVNADINNGDIMGVPYVLLIGGQESSIIRQYIDKRTKSSRMLHTELGLAIMENGGPGDNYGFVWNEREMYKILANYKGDHYVAESIINDFSKQCEIICTQYDLEGRVHIVNG